VALKTIQALAVSGDEPREPHHHRGGVREASPIPGPYAASRLRGVVGEGRGSRRGTTTLIAWLLNECA